MSNPSTNLHPEYEVTDTSGNPQGIASAIVVFYPPADGSTIAQPPPGSSAGNPMYVSGGGSGGSAPTGTAGTPATGTNGASPVFDAATGKGLLTAGTALPAGTNTLGTVLAPTVTFTAPAASSIATGGTAVTALTAGAIVHGFDLLNPSTATETLYFNLVTTATTTASGANFSLQPGQSYHCPFGTTQALSVNAATSGHAFVAVAY